MTGTAASNRYETDLAYLRSVEVHVDSDRTIFYRAGDSGMVGFQVHPSVRTAAGACTGPIDASANVPALLNVAVLGPLLNPTKWGQFSSISTDNREAGNEQCPNRLQGWVGSIVESGTVRACETVYAFENLLTMSFCYSEAQSEAQWTLGRSLTGGFTTDAGAFGAKPSQPDPSVWSSVTAAKTVNWDNDVPVCQVPTELRQLLLEAFIKIGLLEYVFNVLSYVERQGSPAQQAALAAAYEQYQDQYVRALRDAGYDLEQHRLL